MALKRSGKGFIPSIAEIKDEYTSENSELGSEYDDDDYDMDEPVAKQSKRLKSFSSGNESGFRNRSSSHDRNIERLPTRRPNPKISNRNALMARENRRKKKEFMENLQKNVEDTQKENRKLKKLLHERTDKIKKLTQESLYLRSILANKTEILSLLKTIQGNQTPITSSALSFVCDNNFQCNEITSNKRGSVSPQLSTSPQSNSSWDDEQQANKENGTKTTTDETANDPFLVSLNDFDFLFTDRNSVADDLFGLNDAIDTASPSASFASGDLDADGDNFRWEHLLNDTGYNKTDVNSPAHIADLREIDDSEILSTNSNHVNDEHNYFNNPIENKKADGEMNKPGICLHVSSGRVSLEFCATCHISSQNAWIEEM